MSFDDLTHEYHRYTYRLEHCDADWEVSKELFESDYIEGFAEGLTIDDCQESVNTNQLYTHYSFTIPNSNCRLKMSGNYRLTVYDETEGDQPVLSACFMVSEERMDLGISATTNTDRGNNNRWQQVALTLNYGGLKVTNPQEQLRTVVLQNGSWNTAIFNPSPQYVTANGLRWEHSPELIFPGGNEYRKFETLDVNHTTMGLERMGWDGERFHAYVFPDEPRPNYVYDESAKGSFLIRNSDNVENDRASDYLWVHFTLETNPSTNPIYLYGDWTCHPKARLLLLHLHGAATRRHVALSSQRGQLPRDRDHLPSPHLLSFPWRKSRPTGGLPAVPFPPGRTIIPILLKSSMANRVQNQRTVMRQRGKRRMRRLRGHFLASIRLRTTRRDVTAS